MKNKKLKKYTKSAICIFCTILCILSLCICTNAEEVESPTIDFEGPYNAWIFSKESSVFNYESMKIWTDFFTLQEKAGMLLGRKALAVGAIWVSENNTWKLAPFIILSGIWSTTTNENYPVMQIETFTGGSAFGNLPTTTTQRTTAAPLQVTLADGSTINNITEIAYAGQFVSGWVLMESSGLYLATSNSSYTSAAQACIFAKRQGETWLYRERSEWNAWRELYGDTSTEAALVVVDTYNNLYDYVERTADIVLSYDLDIAGIITSTLNAANSIFAGFTDYEIFGISIGATLAAIIIATIIAWIVKKLKGW